MAAVARGYCNLELDLENGERGKRTSGIERLIRELTGAEAATAVNNNAGATVLVLKALAAGREVIVSRGELVEIGGSFRLPEILEVSGAKLREVGTTNKTRLSDYERAIGPETAAILRVHRSNFQIVGFTEAPELPDLVRLAHERGIWAIDDIGSGAIDADKAPPHTGDEPRAAASISAGADVVLFSGDKLLGGPQCGVIAGTKRAIERIESDPLMRALRLDKMVLAAARGDIAAVARPGASGTDSALVDGRRAGRGSFDSCRRIGAGAVRSVWSSRGGGAVRIVPGGGSAPIRVIPSAAVAISAPFPAGVESEAGLAMALRGGDRPVISRVQKGVVLLDLRTVPEDCEADLLDALEKVCHDREARGAGNGPLGEAERRPGGAGT